MNLVISGPQGSGKGTQAKLIAQQFGLVHLETGKLLRDMAGENSPLGKEVASIIESGRLVPDETIFKLLDHKIDRQTLDRGFIIDGTPRTVDQAVWLDQKLAKNHACIDRMLFLDISDKEAVKRLSARLSCPSCGRIYNLITVPPRRPGLCDDDGSPLARRADETPAAIKKRLEQFYQVTLPVLEYYRARKKLVEIDGQRPIETIFSDIVNRLQSYEYSAEK